MEHGASTPNNQRRLVAGMFSKENLISIIRTFTIFSTTDDGKVIKIVARYQQFRAVKKAVERLLNGRNKSERVGLTMTIYDVLETEFKMVGFWDSPPARTRLKSEIQRILLGKDYWNKLPNLQQNYNAVISKILEWSEANNDTIIHGK